MILSILCDSMAMIPPAMGGNKTILSDRLSMVKERTPREKDMRSVRANKLKERRDAKEIAIKSSLHRRAMEAKK